MKVTAYVDGSFDPSVGKYAFGCIILSGEEKLAELCGSGDSPEGVKQRNVAGEMIAAMLAVKWALKNGCDGIDIYYDYTGIENWAMGRWKTNNDLTRKYKETMMSWGQRVKISFHKVAAHTGDRYNEEVDKLAKKGLTMEPGLPQI